jgi:hypothetical protein
VRNAKHLGHFFSNPCLGKSGLSVKKQFQRVSGIVVCRMIRPQFLQLKTQLVINLKPKRLK